LPFSLPSTLSDLFHPLHMLPTSKVPRYLGRESVSSLLFSLPSFSRSLSPHLNDARLQPFHRGDSKTPLPLKKSFFLHSFLLTPSWRLGFILPASFKAPPAIFVDFLPIKIAFLVLPSEGIFPVLDRLSSAFPTRASFPSWLPPHERLHSRTCTRRTLILRYALLKV